MQILAFGDSITYGAWDCDHAGWASQLRIWLDKKQGEDKNLYALTYNLGIPGETTDRLVKRFKPETEARLRREEENVFIFGYGANDACFIPTQNQFMVDADEFERNLDLVIQQAQEFSSRIALLTITPVIDYLTVRPENKDKSRLNKYIGPYNSIIHHLGEKYDLSVLDANAAFMAAGYENLFDEDGLHPNEEGHAILFSLVKGYIAALIES